MTSLVILAGLDAAAGYFSLSRGLSPGWELLAVCASAIVVGACGSALFDGKGGYWPLVGILALPPAMLAGKASVYFASFAVLWILAASGTLPGFVGRGVLRALQLMLGMTGQEHFTFELAGGAVVLPALVVLSAAALAELVRRSAVMGATRAGIVALAAGSATVGVWTVATADGPAAKAICALAALALAAVAVAALVRFSPRAVMKFSAGLVVFTAAYDLSLIVAGAR